MSDLPALTEFAPAVLKGAYMYRHTLKAHPRPIPVPPHYERIELVTGGRGAIEHQGQWRDIAPGDLIWNAPGEMTIGRTDFEDPYRCFSITLQVPRAEGMGVPRFSRWEDLDALLGFSYEMTKHFVEEQVDRAILRDCILGRLLFCVHTDRRLREQGEVPMPLKVVMRWIKLNYAAPCSVEALAEVAGWSAAHLHHAFQRYLKTTPHQALLHERLQRAREQLVTTSYPVKQISVECGFTDTPAFTRLFKGATGFTPGAFRKRHYALGHT